MLFRSVSQSRYIGKYIRSDNGEYLGWIKYDVKHKSCGIVFNCSLAKHVRCPNCFKPEGSKPERELFDVIHDLEESAILRDRVEISPFEIDVLVKSKSIGFEFNGDIWHSSCFQKDYKNYHRDKTELALAKGIKIYHIWEHDNFEIVESMVKVILGKSEYRYQARKLKIKTVDKVSRKIF